MLANLSLPLSPSLFLYVCMCVCVCARAHLCISGQAEQELNDRERQIFHLERKIMELEDERFDTRKEAARCWVVDSKFDALETQASCVSCEGCFACARQVSRCLCAPAVSEVPCLIADEQVSVRVLVRAGPGVGGQS